MLVNSNPILMVIKCVSLVFHVNRAIINHKIPRGLEQQQKYHQHDAYNQLLAKQGMVYHCFTNNIIAYHYYHHVSLESLL